MMTLRTSGNKHQPFGPCERCGIAWQLQFTHAHRKHCDRPHQRELARKAREEERLARAHFRRRGF